MLPDRQQGSSTPRPGSSAKRVCHRKSCHEIRLRKETDQYGVYLIIRIRTDLYLSIFFIFSRPFFGCYFLGLSQKKTLTKTTRHDTHLAFFSSGVHTPRATPVNNLLGKQPAQEGWQPLLAYGNADCNKQKQEILEGSTQKRNDNTKPHP